MLGNTILQLTLLAATVTAVPLEGRQIINSPYRPQKGSCPSTPLIRTASGLNPDEAAWVDQRKPIAKQALKTWLTKTGAYPVLSNADNYPTMAFVAGGGGFRGFLISAGFHQAMDINEPVKYATSGLYQSFVYESGLSGSSLNMATFGWNNWPLASDLLPFWQQGLKDVTAPNGGSLLTKAQIRQQVLSKQVAGYEVTIVDSWARDLAWAGLESPDGGVSQKLSDLPSISGYSSHQNPMPIITCLGVVKTGDACGLPAKNATQYEFTPYEFGSWEPEVNNFIQAKYLGTSVNGGRPSGQCTTGFDNLGFVMATSTNTFNQDCGGKENAINDAFGASAFPTIKGYITGILGNSIRNYFSIIPNPFRGLSNAPGVSRLEDLLLIDGGQTIQVPPVWPYLYRRDVEVLIISDNSADGPANYQSNGTRVNFPSGQQIHNTYLQAIENGIQDRMPYIPPPSTFMANNGNKKPMSFFGCSLAFDSPAMFLIYLPNRAVTFDSNQPAPRLQYDPATTAAMIDNGIAIATNEGDPDFAFCMGCGIMKKSAAKEGKALPKECNACFYKYCWGSAGFPYQRP